MSKFEYKTILLPYKTGLFQSDNVEIAEGLKAVAADGWRLSQIVLPSTVGPREHDDRDPRARDGRLKSAREIPGATEGAVTCARAFPPPTNFRRGGSHPIRPCLSSNYSSPMQLA